MAASTCCYMDIYIKLEDWIYRKAELPPEVTNVVLEAGAATGLSISTRNVLW
ncbi:hypothetical protein AB5N19_03423 [Seiridium cardinale]